MIIDIASAPMRRLKQAFFTSTILILAGALTACGGGGGSSSPPVVVTPPPVNSAPQITGGLAQSSPENETVAFTLGVQDADGDAVTVTIGNSNDGQFFTLDTSTGRVESTKAFDFEMPEDVDGDNVYVQTVTLDDGTVTVNQEITVTITNVDEVPTCNAVAPTNIDENATGSLAMFSGTDPDAGDEAIAVFENLNVTDGRLNGLVSLNGTTGEVNLDTPLNSEEFGANFSFDVSADYKTNALFDTCSVSVSLNDLPTKVTSGILFDTNLKGVQSLTDLNGDGFDDFWIADEVDQSGSGPVGGTLVFGKTLTDSVAATGAAELSVDGLANTEKTRLSVTFPRGTGSDNSRSITLSPISDFDGDGIKDLLVSADQPPSEGLEPTRYVWAYVVYAKTIADNLSDTLDLDALTPTQGFSLTGPNDMNGTNALYVVTDLDGVAGDEIAISLPGAIGPGSTNGLFFVIDNAAMQAAFGNFDFDLDPSTKMFDGPFDVDEQFQIGNLAVIGDQDIDGIDELMMIGIRSVAIISSRTLSGLTGGFSDVLAPLIIDLEGDGTSSIGQADVDGDNVADLLLTRGTGDADTKHASILYGAHLTALVGSDQTLSLNEASFGVSGFVDITSSASGERPDPIRFMGVGDLDGDGLDEVAYSVRENANSEPGSIYILRGSALSNSPTTEFNVNNFTPEQGTEIASVPFIFKSLSTQLSLTPDIDGDGLQDFYVTSNRVNGSDPAGVAIILKSSDVTAALAANEVKVDIERLFFDETP